MICVLLETEVYSSLHIGFDAPEARILQRGGISAYQASWVVYGSVGTISDQFWRLWLAEFSVLDQNTSLSHGATARFDSSIAGVNTVVEGSPR